jgi:hypothetical protein
VTHASEKFGSAALAFRSVLEEASVSPQPVARGLRNAVAAAYLSAALIPRPQIADGDEDVQLERHRAPAALEASLRRRLGRHDEFIDVFDPTESTTADAPIRRTLAGELVEIYEDLGMALDLLEAAHNRPSALWDVVFDFESHWGKHAVDVLRPLHHLALQGI